MEQTSDSEISSFVLRCYRHFLNGNNESIDKLGTDDLKIPRFSEENLIHLCDSAIQILKQINQTMVYISSPSIVIGDLHGNLHDLIRLMNSIIDIFSNRVLFLGDYIDRGQYQLETITLLLALRIEYPDHFFLIRGNHEFASVNAYGGFKDEILESGYSETLYNKLNETFSWLPIAAVINDHIFCVHGGLSPLFHEIKQIETEFKLPIKKIYTSTSNSSKRRQRFSVASNFRPAALNIRSSLMNVNPSLGSNMSFFKSAQKRHRFSDSSDFRAAAVNVKYSLQNVHQTNHKILLNKKLPPLGMKQHLINSPLPSLPDPNDQNTIQNSDQNIIQNSDQNSIQNSNQTPKTISSQQNINLDDVNTIPQLSDINFDTSSPVPSFQTNNENSNDNKSQITFNPASFNISSAQMEMMKQYADNIGLDKNIHTDDDDEDEHNNIELLTDLMWSDPINSCELSIPSNRGAGCYFGFVLTNNFLKRNKMKMIVRGHESIKSGIKSDQEKKIVTIYSSSSVQLGGIAGCAIFDINDNYEEFRLIPINFVQRKDAKFYTPSFKQIDKNKPLKLNSFNCSQSYFYNMKQARKNTKSSLPQVSNPIQGGHCEIHTIIEDE
ncbi:hypothetical protein M9Y10_010075 [Tritrichomonas musculus]|uniref:Serine/threonine-protein phosphatase n=1 Tax=Tritrichomonas musculus TaxID=1915356 RepID=A0ABR2IQ74_9EUKA